MSPVAQEASLYRTRNRSIASSFYQELRSQGFTHEQIIELSATLLRMVTDDMARETTAQAK